MNTVRLKFWGVRGSIPTPGPETVYYGGNTPCVELRVGSEIIILDAGTGIRPLGRALTAEFGKQPICLSVLITHTHWDHIQGFPFFTPAYDPQNRITLVGFKGACQGLHSALSRQMESPYFPISMYQLPGDISIQEVNGLDSKVGGVPVRAQLVNHPGICVGYRLATPAGVVAFLPDVELFHPPGDDPRAAAGQDRDVVEFVRDSEVLILDSQYSADEYQKHTGWGHSCVDDSIAVALRANVRRLFLFHHDSDHSDAEVSQLLERARQIAGRRDSPLLVEAAREGFELVLTQP
jgi:phosphoribosyl 1,2-cyclic phosphodiesterase